MIHSKRAKWNLAIYLKGIDFLSKKYYSFAKYSTESYSAITAA